VPTRWDHDRLVTSARLRLRVQASAQHDEVVAVRNGVLVIRVTAPAVEGRANEALRRLVAKRLGVPKSAITIVRGHHSRDKLIEIDGVDESTMLSKLTN
jgi:uncharacterized protein